MRCDAMRCDAFQGAAIARAPPFPLSPSPSRRFSRDDRSRRSSSRFGPAPALNLFQFNVIPAKRASQLKFPPARRIAGNPPPNQLMRAAIIVARACRDSPRQIDMKRLPSSASRSLRSSPPQPRDSVNVRQCSGGGQTASEPPVYRLLIVCAANASASAVMLPGEFRHASVAARIAYAISRRAITIRALCGCIKVHGRGR